MNVFESCKGSGGKNFDRKGILEEEFVDVLQKNGFFNEKFTTRYGFICFHLALYAKVDEISSLGHMQASFLEFLEAFARVCDLADSNDLEKDVISGFANADYPLDRKIEVWITNFAYLRNKRTRR